MKKLVLIFPRALFFFVVFGLSACNSQDNSSTGQSPAATTQTSQQMISGSFSGVRDDGSPLHNGAIRDANGTVWGLFELSGGSVKDAEFSCNKNGGVLPTAAQLDQLARYLGRGTSAGFHPEYVNEPIPGTSLSSVWDLGSSLYWSAPESEDEKIASCMKGNTGEMESVPIVDTDTSEPTLANALCVFPNERQVLQCSVSPSTVGHFIPMTGPFAVVAGDTKVQVSFQLSPSRIDSSQNILTMHITDLATLKGVSKPRPCRSIVFHPLHLKWIINRRRLASNINCLARLENLRLSHTPGQASYRPIRRPFIFIKFRFFYYGFQPRAIVTAPNLEIIS